MLSLLTGLFLKKSFILLLFIFVLFIAICIRSEALRDTFNAKYFRKIIFAILSTGIVFFLIFGYIIHAKDDDRIVWRNIDSVSYFIQARIFSSGHINVPSHPLKDFFSIRYCINDGKYYSKYFPGWPLVLSMGVFMGVPWIVNPLLGFFTLLIFYLIGKELYDKDTGIFAVVLFLTSSYFYKYVPTYFSDPSALFFSSVFFYCMVRIYKAPEISTSVVAGLSLGIGFLIRPYSAIAVSLPVMVHFLISSFIQKKWSRIYFIAIFLSLLPALFGLLMYNYLQTGSVLLTPFQYYNPFDKIGFGLRSVDFNVEPKEFTLITALNNFAVNLAILNVDSVPFLFLFLAIVLINKMDKWDIMLFAILLSVAFFHFFYFFKVTRYYYVAFFAIFLLGARGIKLSCTTLENIFPNLRLKNLENVLLIFIVMVNVFVINSPQKILHDYRQSIELRDPFNIGEKYNVKNSVVFIKILGRPGSGGMYIQNHLRYEGDILFAKDLNERNFELMNYYPQKNFYFYEFNPNSNTGKLSRIGTNSIF